MILIIEGPDGAGKTTLVNQLAKETGYPVVHTGVPKPGEDVVAQYVLVMKEHGKTGLILDRSWLSDIVYRSAMNDNIIPLTSSVLYSLDCVAQSNGGGMIIYCTAKPRVLWARAKARGETYIKTYEQLENIHSLYEKLFNEYIGLPVVRNVTG